MKFTFIFLFVYIKNKIQQEVLKPCLSTCSTCENTLFFLNTQHNYNCNMSDCPDLCSLLTNQFIHNFQIFELFKSNQINTCNVCIQMNYCKVNECKVKDTIPLNGNVENIIHKELTFDNNSPDMFYFKMFKILKNVNNIIDNLDNLERLYTYSKKLSGLYVKLYKKVLNTDFKVSKYKQFSVKGDYKVKVKKLMHDVEDNLLKNKNQFYEYFLDPKTVDYISNIKLNTFNLINAVAKLSDKLFVEINANLSEIKKIKIKLLKDKTNKKQEHVKERLQNNDLVFNFQNNKDLNSAGEDEIANISENNIETKEHPDTHQLEEKAFANRVDQNISQINNTVQEIHQTAETTKDPNITDIKHIDEEPSNLSKDILIDNKTKNDNSEIVKEKKQNYIDDELFKRLETKVEALNEKLEKITQDNKIFEMSHVLSEEEKAKHKISISVDSANPSSTADLNSKQQALQSNQQATENSVGKLDAKNEAQDSQILNIEVTIPQKNKPLKDENFSHVLGEVSKDLIDSKESLYPLLF
jgi:hypothetical protein